MPVFKKIVILMHSFPSSLGATIAGWRPPAIGKMRKAHLDRHRGRRETKAVYVMRGSNAARSAARMSSSKRAAEFGQRPISAVDSPSTGGAATACRGLADPAQRPNPVMMSVPAQTRGLRQQAVADL
jgi:hypothetical protein